MQPLLAADLHGYTDVLQVEPCGPPHGENYEYDLFIPHGYAMARQVEKDVVAADIPGNTYYDLDTGEVVSENTGPRPHTSASPTATPRPGWDDFPPIFTAQYAAFFGAITSTVELPLDRHHRHRSEPRERRGQHRRRPSGRSRAWCDYVADHGDDLLANQIEMFRRGVDGQPRRTSLTRDDVEGRRRAPASGSRLWDRVDDQGRCALPRAYVIPVGAGQRSADATPPGWCASCSSTASRSAGSTRPATVGGATYPAGSYVVDLHQPLRGLANSLLDLGADISAKVPTMYDISAWSLSYLWGATVDKVGSTTDGPIGATSRGDVGAGRHGAGHARAAGARAGRRRRRPGAQRAPRARRRAPPCSPTAP